MQHAKSGPGHRCLRAVTREAARWCPARAARAIAPHSLSLSLRNVDLGRFGDDDAAERTAPERGRPSPVVIDLDRDVLPTVLVCLGDERPRGATFERDRAAPRAFASAGVPSDGRQCDLWLRLEPTFWWTAFRGRSWSRIGRLERVADRSAEDRPARARRGWLRSTPPTSTPRNCQDRPCLGVGSRSGTSQRQRPRLSRTGRRYRD